MRDEFHDATRVYALATAAVLDEFCPRLRAWEREHGEDAAIALGLLVATAVSLIVGAWT